MIKTKTINYEFKNGKPYPKLMISDGGMVVLFTQESYGTMLVPNRETIEEIGYVSSCFDQDRFKDFDGIVELQNE